MRKQRNTTILVVDEIPEKLQVLIGLWQQQGDKARAAPNGERALVTVRRTPPDLILLDLRMPEMNGYEVFRILDGINPKDIPLVANRKWNSFVNKPLLHKAGIRIPASILQQAENVE